MVAAAEGAEEGAVEVVEGAEVGVAQAGEAEAQAAAVEALVAALAEPAVAPGERVPGPVRELELGQEREPAAVMAPAAVAVAVGAMIPMPVPTARRTRAGGAATYSRFEEHIIGLGLAAAGLAPRSSIRSTNARTARIGVDEGRQRTRGMSTGLTRLSG